MVRVVDHQVCSAVMRLTCNLEEHGSDLFVALSVFEYLV
jgi:hypothetical protein